jgi:ribose transport system substrate-binding protein
MKRVFHSSLILHPSSLGIFLAGLALPGCGNEPSRPENDAALTIAMIAKSSTNPVFLSARTGAEAAAKELSARHGIDIVIDWRTPPTEDGQVQAQRIAQAVNEGADVVLISCSDAAKVTGAIDDAVGRGVPVMTFDSDAPDSRRFAYYGVDDIKTGRLVMEELAKHMNGRGKVAILAGNQNAPNLRKRVEGVMQAAQPYPDISIVGTFYHTETPQDAAAEVVRVNNAYPDITGWAMVGGWALFTQTLLTDLDPARMKVVSVDALPPELAYVDQGIVPVLWAQPTYLWGYESVRLIVDKVHFKKDVPVINPMELVRVSKDTLGPWARQLQAWGFTDVPDRFLGME